MPRKNYNLDLALQEYIEGQKNRKVLATKYSISYQVLCNRIQAYHRNKRLEDNDEDQVMKNTLIRFLNNTKSKEEIANIFNVSVITVNNWIKKYNIDTPNDKDKERVHKTVQYLHRLRLPLIQIKQIVGLDISTIKKIVGKNTTTIANRPKLIDYSSYEEFEKSIKQWEKENLTY